MGFLRDVFGPSREEVWRELCREIGAELQPGSFWKGSRVQAQVRQWTITLDTFTESHGEHSKTYTRLRAPYVNRDGFRFQIYRTGLFTDLGKFFGMQDVEIGEPVFDRDFVIKGNSEQKLRALFEDERIRELLSAQPVVHFMVKDDEGFFGRTFPEGVDELWFAAPGVVKDVARLRGLYDLFAAVLERLCSIGSAYEDRPGLQS